MALDGDTRKPEATGILGFSQPSSGYVEPHGGQREAGEVVVRCAFCDFVAGGPVPLPESVRIGREHREHGCPATSTDAEVVKAAARRAE